MRFRPKFCANCGEKIERADWGLLTSRRFCQVCESEFKGQDLLPLVVLIAGSLLGVFGFGAYLKSDSGGEQAVRQPLKQTAFPLATKPSPQMPVNVEPAPKTEAPPDRRQSTEPPAAHSTSVQRTVASEPAFYCGAETKKGTPCSRRVKGNIRCYQHKGMPAIAPAEQLKTG